jgi:medium-chain acyl-[acyl-carrier-protein] hydrolase
MSEKDFIYEIKPDVSFFNENNCLKPYAYQNMFSRLVERHLSNINLNMDVTMKYNLAWVLISLSVEIEKTVDGIDSLYAQTWFAQRKGPFFRREFVFRNESSEVVFKGSSFSVLLDLESRTIYRKKETPFELNHSTEDFTIEASPNFKTDSEFVKTDDRRVYNSFIDCLGHVNNTRYGEFAYDALDDEEKNNLGKIKRYDMFFLSELRRNDKFSVYKAKDDKNIIIRGINNDTGNISFDIVMKV